MSLVDVAVRGPVRDRRCPAARPRVRAVRPTRAGGGDPGRDRLGRLRVLHRTRARGARGGGPAGRHGPDHVRGPPCPDRVSQRQPELFRVRDLQARPGPRPPGRRAGRRVHRRRRERSLRRGLCGHRVGQAVARPDLPRGAAGISAAGRSSARSRRGWTRPSRRGTRIRETLPGPRRRPLFCGAEVWGAGRVDPPPDAWPPGG